MIDAIEEEEEYVCPQEEYSELDNGCIFAEQAHRRLSEYE
jgi:hypothetical protein